MGLTLSRSLDDGEWREVQRAKEKRVSSPSDPICLPPRFFPLAYFSLRRLLYLNAGTG